MGIRDLHYKICWIIVCNIDLGEVKEHFWKDCLPFHFLLLSNRDELLPVFGMMNTIHIRLFSYPLAYLKFTYCWDYLSKKNLVNFVCNPHLKIDDPFAMRQNVLQINYHPFWDQLLMCCSIGRMDLMKIPQFHESFSPSPKNKVGKH